MVHHKLGWLLAAVAWLIVPRADAQVKNNDSIKGWGVVIDPDSDCQIKGDAGKVTVTVPGTIHDFSIRMQNAPRVLQEIDGDFILQVKVSGDFDPGNNPAVAGTVAFCSAGLMIWENEENYLRLERNLWYTPGGQALQYPPLLEYWKSKKLAFNVRSTKEPFFQGRSTHLRLERRGNQILASLSHDGFQWLAGKPVNTEFSKKVKVGILAINTSKRPLMAEFEEFRLTPGNVAVAKEPTLKPVPVAPVKEVTPAPPPPGSTRPCFPPQGQEGHSLPPREPTQ